MKKILLVDDEEKMLDLLSLYLTPHNYQCIKTTSGSAAVSQLKSHGADLVILDGMMPNLDGWETCTAIRKFSNIPIMILTAKKDKSDVIRALRLGADAYMTKPFHEEELLARIEALIRRSKTSEEKIILFNGLSWNENAFEVRFQDKVVPLTPKEFQILGLFLENHNKIFTRDYLMEALWDQGAEIDGRTIDSHMRNIRDKLRAAHFPIDYTLTTVRGVGYSWKSEAGRSENT